MVSSIIETFFPPSVTLVIIISVVVSSLIHPFLQERIHYFHKELGKLIVFTILITVTLVVVILLSFLLIEAISNYLSTKLGIAVGFILFILYVAGWYWVEKGEKNEPT